MEAMRRFLDRQDVDIGGQLVVDPASQGLRRQARVELEVRDLRERVDARVGAARAVELEFASARDLADGAIDLALHRAGVLLDLPAAVSRAGVLDDELESRHQRLALRAPAIFAATLRGTSRTLWAPILLATPGTTSARPASIAS